MPNLIQLTKGSQAVLPIAMIRYQDGRNTVESIRIVRYIGSKMAVINSTIRASGIGSPDETAERAYSTQIALYGVDPRKPDFRERAAVRCSCFTGDTLVMLPEGKSVPISSLVGRDYFYVFAYDINDRKVKIAKAIQARKTGAKQKIIKVTLDNGSVIRCTPDHLFLKKGGCYAEARNLAPGTSLMAAYRKRYQGSFMSRGYRMIAAPGMAFQMEHYLADHYNLHNGNYLEEQGDVRHHYDFDADNNSPENIVRMNRQDHIELHKRMRSSDISGLEKLWNDPEWRKQKSKSFSNTLKSLATRGIHPAQLRVDEGTHHWQDGSHSEAVSTRQSEFNSAYRTGLKILSKLYENGIIDPTELAVGYEECRKQGTPKFPLLISKFGSLDSAVRLATEMYLNHKVISVVECGTDDVYDITVPGYENFCIDVDGGADCSSGVFVHNCASYYFWFSYANRVAGASYGARFAPYIRKTRADDPRYPPRNESNIPGMCKHLLLLTHTITQSGFFDTGVERVQP